MSLQPSNRDDRSLACCPTGDVSIDVPEQHDPKPRGAEDVPSADDRVANEADIVTPCATTATPAATDPAVLDDDVADGTGALVAVGDQAAALASITSPLEAKEVRDRAAAAEAYFKQKRGENDGRIVAAAVFRLRAERHIGGLLEDLVHHGGDRRSSSSRTSLKLADIGVSHDQSSRWQRLAAIPEDDFEQFVEMAIESGTAPSTSAALDLVASTQGPGDDDEWEEVPDDDEGKHFVAAPEVDPEDDEVDPRLEDIERGDLDARESTCVAERASSIDRAADRTGDAGDNDHDAAPRGTVEIVKAPIPVSTRGPRGPKRRFKSKQDRIDAVRKLTRQVHKLHRDLKGSSVATQLLNELEKTIASIRMHSRAARRSGTAVGEEATAPEHGHERPIDGEEVSK